MLGSLGFLLVSAALLWLFVQIACTYHASNMAHVRRHGKDDDGDGGMVWLPSILPVWFASIVHCQHVWQLVIVLHFFHSLSLACVLRGKLPMLRQATCLKLAAASKCI